VELRHIRYFLALAEERNFTRAARRLGIGQPPLSQQIRDLEAEVGCALFRRLPHGAELTAAGEAFLAHVRDMPQQAARATAAALRSARGETGSIRVGFTGSAAFNPRVPMTIRAYRRRYPDVSLSLREANSNGLVAALLEGTLDAAFLRPESVSEEGLRFQEIEREPMIAAIASGRMADDRPVALIDLKDDPFIATPRPLGPTLYDAIVSACRRAGFEPVMGQSAPQIASVLSLVAAELGVALVPASMRDVVVKGVSYHDLTGDFPFATLAIATRRDERSPTVSAFVAEARFV
jgi:DNA-binding transcriptional LysR family regulator